MKMIISNIRHLAESNTVVACLSGKCALHKEIQVLDDFLNEQHEKNIRNFILHFKKVSYISSYGVAIMSLHINSIRNNSGKFIIYEPHPQAENTLRIVSFDKKVLLCRNYEEALSLLGKTH